MSISSSSSKLYTIDEYRKAISYLKTKYKKIELENAELNKQYAEKKFKKGSKEKINMIYFSAKLQRMAIRIQAAYKGRKERLQFQKKLLRIQEEEVYVQDPSFNTTQELMVKLANFFKSNYGLTLEHIFRMLDEENEKMIQTEDFKIFLQDQKKLKFSQAQLVRLMFLFDEECRGFIDKVTYHKILSSFGVQTEVFQQMVLEQELLNDICEAIIRKSYNEKSQNYLDGEGVFTACSDRLEDTSITSQQFFLFCETLGLKFTAFQHKAINNIFGLERNGKIEKQEFIHKIDLGIKAFNKKKNEKLVQKKRDQSQRSIQSSNNLLQLPMKHQKKRPSQKRNSDNKSQTSIKQFQSGQGIKEIDEKFEEDEDENQEQEEEEVPHAIRFELEKIFQAIDESQTPIYLFLESLLENINMGIKNLNEKDVNAQLTKFYSEKIKTSQKGLILQQLKPDSEGNLELMQTIQFFKSHSKDQRVSLRLIMLILAKQLEFQCISTEQYFKDNNAKIDIWYTQNTFSKTIGPLIGLKGTQCEKLFQELDTEKKQRIQGKTVIRAIDYLRKDRKNPLIQTSENNKNQGFTQINEMKKFKQQLAQHGGIHFNGIWILADKERKNQVSLNQLLTVIQQKTKNQIPERQLIYWLDLIDTNRNGIIDQQEFELTTATEESDLSAFRVSTGKIENEKEIIQLFIDALHEKQLTPQQFFDFTDISGDKEINLLELKNGLAALDIDLTNLIQLMQIFDKNLDGTITIDEYMETLGSKFVPPQVKEIQGFLCNNKGEEDLYDERADMGIKVRLDQFGEEKQDELLHALRSLKKFCLGKYPNYKIAYEKLFSEFDTNGDKQLSRIEFLQGLDKFNKDLQLSERQKIRLMELADKDKNDQIDFDEFQKFLNQVDEGEKKEDIKTKKQQFKNLGGFVEQDKRLDLTEIDIKSLKKSEQSLGKLRNMFTQIHDTTGTFKFKFQKLKVKKDEIEYIHGSDFMGLLEEFFQFFTKEDKQNIQKYIQADQNGFFEYEDLLTILKNLGEKPFKMGDDLDEAGNFNYEEPVNQNILNNTMDKDIDLDNL